VPRFLFLDGREKPELIPILFHLGPFRVHSYGVMLAVAFLLGTWWAMRSAGRRGIDPDRVASLVGWILIASIAGARLHFVLGHPGSFSSPLDFFRIWEGGLTLYGGLIAAIIVSFLYLRRHRLRFLPIADAIAPALAFGEGFTRIGCFLNGCCFGAACAGGDPLCIRYPKDSYAADALGDVPVYPAQLFLSAGMFAVFFILFRMDRMRDRLRPGVIFGSYLILQGIIRYVVDFFRYYEPVDRVRVLAPIIETKSQVVALLLVVVGILFVTHRAAAAGKAARETNR
jgi:phosphatidylglycerol:prolipoprotein diacylglycerol transferase